MSRAALSRSACAFALVLGLAGSLGCQSYAALREGRYEEVSPETIHAAGSAGAEDLPDALEKLLLARLEDPSAISEEQAIEAVISLGESGEPRHGPAILAVLERDPSADARYFAIGALDNVAPEILRASLPQLLEQEKDPLALKRLKEFDAR